MFLVRANRFRQHPKSHGLLHPDGCRGASPDQWINLVNNGGPAGLPRMDELKAAAISSAATANVGNDPEELGSMNDVPYLRVT